MGSGIIGVVFLLGDLGIWNFWNIQWYTAAFIVFGVVKLCSSCCPDCNACCRPEKPAEKGKK